MLAAFCYLRAVYLLAHFSLKRQRIKSVISVKIRAIPVTLLKLLVASPRNTF